MQGMGKTITEKILARASGREEVSVGEYIQIRSDRPTKLRGESGNKGILRYRDIKSVANPNLVILVDGHSGVGGGKKIGDIRVSMRKWAKDMGIPDENIINLGRAGVEHIISGEHCWPLPGGVYFSITNGHTSALGAIGAFAVSLSYESGAYIITGSSWAQVPPTTKIEITGTLSKGVTARDVCEYVIGQLGPTGTPGHVMEWTGPVIEKMAMDARFTICSNAIFTGAWAAIINPDRTTIDYVKSCTNDPFEPAVSDRDATYLKTFRFDVSQLEPQIVPPPKRTDVFSISKYRGTKVDWGFIGTCINARMDDMRLAAQILKGRKIHPKVVLNITPGSSNIYKQCIREGILEIFADAGVCIVTPSCGMCNGSNTPLGTGDVCISTGPCNYPGRMGSDKASIYIGSPATVAASAIAGEITDPRDFL
jgi:3-isopropylmalate/(R)-2-methylmalate dehydratase large subunit